MGCRVAVVGGGITGLAAAWELSRAGVVVSVLEGSDRIGGKLRVDRVGGDLIDVGAESVLARRPEAVGLIRELGLGQRLTHPAAVSATIVSGGRQWPMPTGTLMGVPSDPESVRGLLTDAEVERLHAEQLTGPTGSDLAVGAFLDDRLGPAVTDKLVEPLLAGVYAGHSRAISLEMAVPVLDRAAREGRSVLEAAREAARAAQDGPQAGTPVFATLVGGLGSLPDLLGEALVARGVEIRTDTTVRAVRPVGEEWVLVSGPTIDEREEPFDAVVIATPAAPTARLLGPVAPESARHLSGIEYASMAIVSLVLDGRPVELATTSGFLVPPTEPLTIKASTFSSTKWPWLRAAHPDRTFLRASIGRHREEASLQRTDDELVEVALRDLATVLGSPLTGVVGSHVQRWGGGLPQYAVGHRSRVEAARAALPPTLVLGGAAYDGVGIPACIGSGRAAAGTLLTRLRDAGADLG
ncbi:protoporphyrinogen oxidase [Intrasporangium oryzae NRRL B-24470]|uniref:Coproporphyrinogen III oxidase n=1 Tax=Intrasporangium oryzae NRRL B-24470 TaxID=1386089 RepID=W9GDH6_9MICO|nr:protoporphyrinogen oxidase [Intrasporangium oryzae]EWT01914.1 protoporphyrinogen oxidase [Intrasporangium oryzae NRRL B-24470]